MKQGNGDNRGTKTDSHEQRVGKKIMIAAFSRQRVVKLITGREKMKNKKQ